MRFCDSNGNEVLHWQVDEPTTIELHQVLRDRIEQAGVQISISSLGGVYLGTANSALAGVTLPTEPGTYPIRFTLDPNPLAEGDYLISPQVQDVARRTCVWAASQPRTLSIRGNGSLGSLLRFNGLWEVKGNQPV
jgi:hypothetical protein